MAQALETSELSTPHGILEVIPFEKDLKFARSGRFQWRNLVLGKQRLGTAASSTLGVDQSIASMRSQGLIYLGFHGCEDFRNC